MEHLAGKVGIDLMYSFNQQLNYEETQKLQVKKKEKPLTLEEAYKVCIV
jgi:hypothetical protein